MTEDGSGDPTPSPSDDDDATGPPPSDDVDDASPLAPPGDATSWTAVGFTWGETDGLHWLRRPDGQYKRVESGFLETLRDLAAGDRSATTLSADERTAVELLADEGYLHPDAAVSRLETPDPIALRPRLFAFVAAFVALSGYVAYRLLVSGTTIPTVATADVDVLSRLVVVLPVFLVLSLVHEAGHYHAASSYFDTSVEFSMLNGVFPAIVTKTNDAWRCPRSVRIWINLAGPFVDCCQCLVLAAASLVLFPESRLLALVPVFQYLRILFSLNPLIRGDGYWMLVDWFGATNLHSRGLRDLKNARPTARAAYAVGSGAFTVLGGLLMVFFVGRLVGIWG